MIYLKALELPTEQQEENSLFGLSVPSYHQTIYPFKLFPTKRLSSVTFGHITIFTGSNGSGKSTLLNIIANLLQVSHSSAYNASPYMSRYQELCDIDIEQSYTTSKIITSDDVFKMMFNEREANDAIHKQQVLSLEEAIQKKSARVTKIDFTDRESLNNAVESYACKEKNGIRNYVLSHAGKDHVLYSNGENAMDFFASSIKHGGLYLLDEPENSLSPAKQLLLKTFIEGMARIEDCQFIIATHSPFIMALNYSRLYDLDDVPAKEKKWYELEHVKQYYDFFKRNNRFFQ